MVTRVGGREAGKNDRKFPAIPADRYLEYCDLRTWTHPTCWEFDSSYSTFYRSALWNRDDRLLLPVKEGDLQLLLYSCQVLLRMRVAIVVA